MNTIDFNDLDNQSPPNSLGRFCGRWKDDRDADGIIAEIMEGRQMNSRFDEITSEPT